jgi:hypothetical protein
MNKKNTVSESSTSPNDTDQPEKPSPLPGWPGYRTRQGRTGLDPIDSGTEAGHTAGAFIQKLISGQLIIQNPIYLFVCALVTLVLIVPSIAAIVEMVTGNAFLWETGIYFVIMGVCGLVGLNILIRNLIRLLSR